jgi:hypothetical protein
MSAGGWWIKVEVEVDSGGGWAERNGMVGERGPVRFVGRDPVRFVERSGERVLDQQVEGRVEREGRGGKEGDGEGKRRGKREAPPKVEVERCWVNEEEVSKWRRRRKRRRWWRWWWLVGWLLGAGAGACRCNRWVVDSDTGTGLGLGLGLVLVRALVRVLRKPVVELAISLVKSGQAKEGELVNSSQASRLSLARLLLARLPPLASSR